MAPPAGRPEIEGDRAPDTPPPYQVPQPDRQPAPLPQPLPEPDEPPPADEPPFLGPIAIYVVYRCPLFWCPVVICQWIGPINEMYDHFVLEWEHHGDDVVVVEDVNEPTLCEWPSYVQTCDIGGEENGFYRLLMRTHGNMIFLLSAKANNDGITGLHVIYIGEAERAERYSCRVSIENHGEEAAAPINLTLACGPTDGVTDIITINQQVGVTLQNEVLKSCCLVNGSLHFWVELQIPEDEISDDEEDSPDVIIISDDDEDL